MTTLAIVLVVGTPIAFAVAIAACAVWERIWEVRNPVVPDPAPYDWAQWDDATIQRLLTAVRDEGGLWWRCSLVFAGMVFAFAVLGAMS